MLKWALIFLVISVIAGLFGFGKISNISGNISKFIFFIIIGIVVLLVIFGRSLF
jgi:uncharacterized membrane protein YtjA (UPF0391 family)